MTPPAILPWASRLDAVLAPAALGVTLAIAGADLARLPSFPLPGDAAARWTPSVSTYLAWSALFGLIFVRLAVTLFNGHYGRGARMLWLAWWSMLIVATLAVVSGQFAGGSQAGFWFGVVFHSILSAAPGCTGDCKLWALNVMSQPGKIMLPYRVEVGLLVVLAGLIVVLTRRRMRRADLVLTTRETVITLAGGISAAVALAALMSWRAPFINPDIYLPANPLSTPLQILPDWYLAPWFQMIRGTLSKYMGSVTVLSAWLVPFLLPVLAFGPRSMPFRVMTGIATVALGVAIVTLAFGGRSGPDSQMLNLTRLSVDYYFAYFLLIMPLLNLLDSIVFRRDR